MAGEGRRRIVLIENGKTQAQTIHYTVVDDRGRLLVRADGSKTDLAW